MQRYCRVALDSSVFALDRPFDYAIPGRMAGRVRPGSVVRVGVHGRTMRAYVLELLDRPAVSEPRELSQLVSPEPLFSAETIDLARWVARRYVAPLGAVLHQAVPGRYSAPSRASAPEHEVGASEPLGWLDDPKIVEKITDSREAAVVVLPHPDAEPQLAGAAVSAAARSGGRALVIVPRVDQAEALAAQLEGAVLLHGDQRPADRAASWAHARDGSCAAVVGTRAALFAPLPQLRCVLVASAHDRALKEERSPRLHALEVARRRAEIAGAAFIASSPAPPLELAGPGAPAVAGPKRGVGRRVRPEIVAPRPGPVTSRLVDAVRSATAAGRDALVFAGRRGGALRVRCDECGWYPRCPECAVPLTAFSGDVLRCRGCGRDHTPPSRCAVCGGTKLSGRGWGNERVAAELDRALDGEAPVVRVDADAPLPADRPRPAVVVGTIAAAWELAPASAGAVCVADLDQLLGLPDFRAAEHALQTLHDLSGALAAGGRFVLQTREPEHHAAQAFARASYRYFADRELPLREAAGYPPYGHVVRVEAEREGTGRLDAIAAAAGGRAVGPLPRPKGRSAMLLRVPELEPLLDGLRELAASDPTVRIDVDPTDVL